MKSLLIISCSSRKSRQPGKTPAMKRYDGNTYRVIRKAQRDGSIRRDLDVKIISAKFGLIDGLSEIPCYDQRMNRARAKQLKPQIQKALNTCLQQANYFEMYVDLGKDYLIALEGFTVPSNINQQYAAGKIGERLRALKSWLSL